MVTDTRKCEPNASDTLSVPSKPEFGPPNSTCFTSSTSHVLTETNKDVSKITSFTGSDLRELSNTNKDDTKILPFTSSTLEVTQNKKDISPNPTHFTGSYTDSEKITVSPDMDTLYMWPETSHFTIKLKL